MTSAPNQASICVHVGPDCTCVMSRIRIPSRAFPMSLLPWMSKTVGTKLQFSDQSECLRILRDIEAGTSVAPDRDRQRFCWTVTHARPRRLSSVLGIVLALLAVFVSIARGQNGRAVDTERLKGKIDRGLDRAPRKSERLLAPRQAGVRLLDVTVRDTSSTQTIAIDLSQRALTYDPSGNLEPLLDAVIQATASAVGPKQVVEYTFTIEGLPVDQFVPRVARLSRQAQSVAAGGVVLVSPGHGLYWDDALASWHLQRPRIRGIVED